MEVTRTFGTVATIQFPLIDGGTADFESTPVTFASGDTQIRIDNGSFANTGSNPVHRGNGTYSLALTVAEMSGTILTVTIIDQTATKAWEDQSVIISTLLGAWAEGGKGIMIGLVNEDDFTATTIALEATRVAPNTTEETTADHYNGRLITFTSGDLILQQTDITDYVAANSKEKFTYSTLTEAPSAGDRFLVT